MGRWIDKKLTTKMTMIIIMIVIVILIVIRISMIVINCIVLYCDSNCILLLKLVIR